MEILLLKAKNKRVIKGWLRWPIYHFCSPCDTLTTNYRGYFCGYCGRTEFKRDYKAKDVINA